MKLIHKHFFLSPNENAKSIIIPIFCLLIICIVGPFSINIGIIDFSFQTLCIMILSLFVRPLLSFLLIVFYLILGGLGLPVFSGYSAGLSHLQSVSAGFLFAFPFFAWYFSQRVSKHKGDSKFVFTNSILSQLGLLIVGFSWIMINYEMSFYQMWDNITGLMPGLLIKSVLITLINYLVIHQVFNTKTIH